MNAIKNQLLILACGLSLVLPGGAARAQDSKRVPDLNQGVEAVDASVHAGVDEITVQDPQPTQEPLKPPPTPPTASSRWGFVPSGQPPATQFWPARASMASSTGTQSDAKGALTPTNPSYQADGQPRSSSSWSARPGDPSLNSQMEGNTDNPAPQLIPFHNFNPGSAKKALARSERFRTDAPPLSTQPQVQFNGLSSPFSSRPQSDGFSTPFSSQAETDGFSTPFTHQQLESNSARISSPHSFSQASPSSKRARAEVKPHERPPHKTPAGNHAGVAAGFQGKPEKQPHSWITPKVD
jgi:hypothetical protein